MRSDNYGMMIHESRHRLIMHTLPLTTQLPDGRPVTVDYMSDDQITATYNMIQLYAKDGEGFAIDEYLNEADFRDDIQTADCFSVVCQETGELLASIILAVSKFYRGSSGAVDPFVIVKKSERHKGIGKFVMKKVIEFSKLLGYMGIYVDTFCNNKAMQRILETVGGFAKVGYLPLGGKLKNGAVVGSYIYFRDLSGDG